MGIHRFVKAMKERKGCEWVDIKELTPLKFMPYVARLFLDITGRDLKGLGDYMEWVGCGILPLEAVRAGPAQCLPMPPRATGA